MSLLGADQALEQLRVLLSNGDSSRFYEIVTSEKRTSKFSLTPSEFIENSEHFLREAFVALGDGKKFKTGRTKLLETQSLGEFVKNLDQSVEIETSFSRKIRPLEFDGSKNSQPKKGHTHRVESGEMVQRLLNLMEGIKTKAPECFPFCVVSLESIETKTWQWSSGSKKVLSSVCEGYRLEARVAAHHSIPGLLLCAEEAEFLKIDWSGFLKALVEQAGGQFEESKKTSIPIRDIETGNYQILFLNIVAPKLVRALWDLVSGDQIGNAALSIASQGQKFFSDNLSLYDDPFVNGKMGSKLWDREGVATTRKDFFKSGIFLGHAHSYVSADRAGAKTTGHATGFDGPFGVSVGYHNLIFEPGTKSKTELLAQFPKLLVINKIHFIENLGMESGDLRILVSGSWLEDSRILFETGPFLIRTSWKEIFKSIHVDREIWWHANLASPSILCENVSVVGPA